MDKKLGETRKNKRRVHMNKKTYYAPIASAEEFKFNDVLSASTEDTNSLVKDSYDWLEGGI